MTKRQKLQAATQNNFVQTIHVFKEKSTLLDVLEINAAATRKICAISNFLKFLHKSVNFKTQVPNEHTLIYNDCEEEWCFAMITSTSVGGETTMLQGCESRSMLKHLENRENETAWQLSDPFFKQIRCSQIVTNETQPDVNDTRRECVDFEYMDAHHVHRTAKLCCCSGSDFCNQQIGWSDSARFLQDELIVDEDDTDAQTSEAVTPVLTNLLFTVPLYSLVLTLCLQSLIAGRQTCVRSMSKRVVTAYFHYAL
ncbi:hypothetical protein M3Y97_00421200 [Aphelenchoides bicaudatus]|nr:hypothetical protein M3Y97_00421200 [Aphelenchoides bicaudatus]